MIRILSVLILLAITAQLQAQSNAPVRLALISETDPAATAVDVLTVQFSRDPKIQLLERDQIAKVYREQGLLKANMDYLKLGQILGADGLLLLETTGEGTNQFLNVRLIAVKPGVVVVAEKFARPVKDPTGWSAIFAKHLDIFLPKLTVLVKDAIPISIVNLRSAVNSAEAGETEQQLKLLTIQRLSREPQLFVLERQRMQLLTEEKDLKLDDSAFWNGSYLLEGVVDQNGYSKETITINARLTPPKGGAPLVFEVSGSRTNLPEVVNQLAAKVTEALKVNATVKAWNAADEAAQYFDEAKWAFKWALYQEAQSAAESAWALGKQDMDCAIIRIRSYEKPSTAMTTSGEVIDRGLINDPEKSERDSVIKDIKDIVSIHPGAVFQFLPAGLVCTTIENSPDPQQLARLNRAVEIYREFSQNFRVDDLKPDSIWYQLGVEVLGSAARTLQHFYLVPQSQAEVSDRLVELRSKARWIDEWITQSPSVHDSFFAENPDPDKEWRMLTYGANIYSCEVNWGCFWQEKPEDCVALYRGLLKSPAFHFFTDEIGGSPARISNHRELESPLVVAWNKGDRMRIQNIWDNFIQDLDNSTNLFLQKESKNFRDIATPAGLNEEEIISQYLEYWQDIQAAKMNGVLPGSQEQKEAPDLTSDINELMSTDSTTASMAQKAQALELKPRLVVYKANLIQKMQVKSSAARRNLMMEVNAITGVQSRVESTLNATPPKAVLKTDITLPTSNPVEARANTAGTSSDVANVLFVRNYLAIPTDNLPSDNGTLQTVRIIDSRWSEGKLLLNLWWGQNPTVGLPLPAIASAIFDPTNKSWETILYPTNDSGTLSDIESMELFHGVLYVVRTEDAILDGNEVGYKERILKYDAPLRQWQALEIPMQDIFKNQWSHTRLWVVNDHLYGVNPTSIFETTSDDKEFRLLASTRRRPAASLFDSLSDLGSPVLFSGPNRSLCASLGNASFGWEQNKTFQWDGNDWHELFALKISQPPETFEDAVVFRYAKLDYMNNPSMVWFWDKHQAAPELALYGEPKGPRPNLLEVNRAAQTTSPLWRSPGNDVLAKASVAYFKSNLFLYVDQAGIGHLPNGTPIPERSSVDADLICLDRDRPQPIVIPLKYDSARGPLPWAGTWPSLSPVWMTFTSDSLLIGNKDVAGIWAIPLAELNAAVAKQKQALPVPNGNQQDTKP